MKRKEADKSCSIKLSNIYVGNFLRKNKNEDYKLVEDYKTNSRFKKRFWINKQNRFEKKVKALGRNKYKI